jgi:subtilisin family serine protease
VRFAVFVLLAPLVANGEPRVSARARMIAHGLLPASALSDGLDDRAAITVRISGGAAALRRSGFEARPLAGDIAALRVTADELRHVIAAPGVLAIEERRILHPLLDAAGPAIGAPAARAETGFDGRGVLVGIVDTGSDITHPDLRDADGHTRIDSLLDLGIADPGNHSDLGDFGGRVWLRDEIDAALAPGAAAFPSRDVNGHGTHVAGIAASSGLATGNGLPAGRYVGVAPGAELVIAKATRSSAGGFLDADVLTACRFAIARADALARPLALNLSLGGAGGPHDGSTNLEAALGALIPLDAPGRVLVVAAGNEGSRDLHAGGWQLGGDLEVPIEMSTTSVTDGTLALEVWTTGPVVLSVVSPTGARTGPVQPGASLSTSSPEANVVIDNFSRYGARADLLQEGGITIAGPPGKSPAAGTWRVLLSGRAARWDVWMVETPGGLPTARFSDHVSEDDRLAIPGTASNAISVGSFVSKAMWSTVNGVSVTRKITVGDPSSFSAMGPTADGRFSPDVIAPGEFIASALSADAHPDQTTSAFFVGGTMADFAWADDGVHGLLRGTSQAAPQVAGAAALLLQADPTLTGGAIRELLRSSARDDAAGFSPRLGFGKLDVLAALRALRHQTTGALDPIRSSVGVSRDALPPGEQTTLVTVTPRDSAGEPLGPGRSVEIALSAGDAVGPVRDMGWGRYERTFVAHAKRGQVGVITCTVDGVTLATHPSVYFVVSRSEIGRPFSAAGGCSASGARSFGLFALLLLGATFFRVRRPNR